MTRVYILDGTKPGEVCRIDITPEYKIRRFNRGTSTTTPDPWILYRRDVPTFTDQDWYASPGAGWRLVEQPTTQGKP